MYRLHLKRNLRSLLFLLGLAAMLTAGGALWWANHIGMPTAWRATLERELAKKGAHVRLGGLSWLPLRGLAATDVVLFADPELRAETARLGRMLIDLDKTKLARGIIRVTRIEMKQADLLLPLEPGNPQSRKLQVDDVEGTLLVSGSRQFEIRRARGRVHGIEVNLDARLRMAPASPASSSGPIASANPGYRFDSWLDLLESLETAGGSPPQLTLQLEWEIGNPLALRSAIRFTAASIGRSGVMLDDVAIDAVFEEGRLTLHSLRARDKRGQFQATADYDTTGGDGRFELTSTLDAPTVLGVWFGLSMPRQLEFADGLKIKAQGGFERKPGNSLQVHATGEAASGPILMRGIRFDRAESRFSIRGKDWFLRDAVLTHPQGTVKGKAMLQGSQVRIAAESDLPVDHYKALFTSEAMHRLVDDFDPREGATFHLTVDGAFEPKVAGSWSGTGTARMTDTGFRSVPLLSAECAFGTTRDELRFSSGKVVFDYRGDPLRQASGGPTEGTATVQSVSYRRPAGTVELREIGGSFQPAPLVRLFSTKVAESLEPYHFQRPPTIRASGLMGVGTAGKGKTDLEVGFRSDAPATYRFLGADLELEAPAGTVRMRDGRLDIDDLRFSAMGGPVDARFRRDPSGMLAGELSWSKLSQARLQETWGMSEQRGGELSGRLNFTMMPRQIATMNGKGNLLLEKTELFSVPVFGPLSPLISAVVSDRRAGFERAKTAWCSHTIRKGVMTIDEFHTETASLFFTGDGTVDLGARTIDMTLRMNARGLLGLLTLPIRPLYGLFQFRGTGPLGKPTWENVMFTTPPDSQMQQLNQPPKASKVIPES